MKTSSAATMEVEVDVLLMGLCVLLLLVLHELMDPTILQLLPLLYAFMTGSLWKNVEMELFGVGSGGS